MTFIGQCIPCQFGYHDEHHEVIQAVPEGVMGGAVCGCKGECRDQPHVEAMTVSVRADTRGISRAFDDIMGKLDKCAGR